MRVGGNEVGYFGFGYVGFFKGKRYTYMAARIWGDGGGAKVANANHLSFYGFVSSVRCYYLYRVALSSL